MQKLEDLVFVAATAEFVFGLFWKCVSGSAHSWWLDWVPAWTMIFKASLPSPLRGRNGLCDTLGRLKSTSASLSGPRAHTEQTFLASQIHILNKYTVQMAPLIGELLHQNDMLEKNVVGKKTPENCATKWWIKEKWKVLEVQQIKQKIPEV